MTLEQFYQLQREQGRELLGQLAHEPLNDENILPVLERYRKDFPAELVAAAVELQLLRKKARGKFSHADVMFFTRDGMEMASAEPVARHTARRFSGIARVMDLCCGIGGDALALADVCQHVIAVDRDALALAMARANAQAVHLEKVVEFLQADVTELMARPPVLFGKPDAIFIDPSRREARAAAKRPESYAPPLSWCLGLVQIAPRVGIKVSPALDYEEALAATSAEVEIVSLHGECKEAMLWLGHFRTCTRRATVLPAGVSLTDDGPTSDALGDVGDWLYEPDGAIIRAHLVQRLAGELSLHRIDPEIAYLSGDREIASPFVNGYRVTSVIPWNLKRLNVVLKERGIKHITIKKRGFPLTPEELRPKLKLSGSGHATLICTKIHGKPAVILTE
ncbi:MAG TPA: class I SAM-dependent methyltransferase [Armatimonadota bacterium]|nr:class I SAM-dependent methyltransferase [Armatimonadota bacterium]